MSSILPQYPLTNNVGGRKKVIADPVNTIFSLGESLR